LPRWRPQKEALLKAGRLWAARETLEPDLGYPVLDFEGKLHDELIDACQQADPAAFAAGPEIGRHMSHDEIFSDALSDGP
jgi:hypothetical protein